ncbi:helix-turn-helix transcriptional regulator [Pseudomonas lactis]|uniref:Helix-turn-helix transcriptional regulator n=1 Tax=Pseudomonas lactis TaxID=1615674 RepID=A0A7Y1M7A1_9PSED|nr:helix-turn-helix domain-containing protein [Pseudomonas lactis]NNA76494.1 helix-turn-helix transcriptional regulator [Pseudomonas lactis]
MSELRMSSGRSVPGSLFKAYLIRTSIMYPVLDILGDPWTLAIIRSIINRPKRFVCLAEELKISRAALSARLDRLEEQGCITRRQYCETPPRYEYLLTEMGRALKSTLVLLQQWNFEWLEGREQPLPAPLKCHHCNKDLKLTVVCQHCSKSLSLDSMRPLLFQQLPEEIPPLQSYRRTRHALVSKESSSVSALSITAEEWLRDRWSSLIVGAFLFGVHRFNDVQSILDIAPNILAGRLELLQQAGILCRVDEAYKLLARGVALYPAIMAMSDWGRKWLPADQVKEVGWRMLHIPCGNWADQRYACLECGGHID